MAKIDPETGILKKNAFPDAEKYIMEVKNKGIEPLKPDKFAIPTQMLATSEGTPAVLKTEEEK